MTLCYFCQESFTPDDEFELTCPACRADLYSQFTKNLGDRELTAENALDSTIKGFRDFADELPKRFAQSRILNKLKREGVK